MKKSFLGYISSLREHGPHKVQNLVIRNYVEKLDGVFHLSATEYNISSKMVLKGLQDYATSIDAIVFYTIDQMPQSDEGIQNLIQPILSAKCDIHFALEEIHINDNESLHKLKDTIFVKGASSNYF